ncbi:capsule biosynthesis protein [Burkholderia cenocepacia]
MPKSFLLLQGTASPFFCRLAEILRDRGNYVQKINFCGGDLLYSGRNSWNFTGEMADLKSWYGYILSRVDFSDIVMFGDCREVHQHMHPLSNARGLKTHVFEEGYVRPHWVTLERHGVNGRSLMSRDPKWFLERRSSTPPTSPAKSTGYNLIERTYHDIRYRAANALYSFKFPGYRNHRPRNGLMEYSGLALRALFQRRYEAYAEAVIRDLISGGCSYYVFPLQLNSDAQIVYHSPFQGVRESIEFVVRSFSRFASRGDFLVIKNHPLDTGLIDYRDFTKILAKHLGIEGRVIFIDAGHLPTLLEYSRGVVVVNSTVGLSALHHRKPLVALGTAIYDIEGLTWQEGLDDFWKCDLVPDVKLYRAFLDYVIHNTQINGDFYTRTGIEMGVKVAASRLDM